MHKAWTLNSLHLFCLISRKHRDYKCQMGLTGAYSPSYFLGSDLLAPSWWWQEVTGCHFFYVLTVGNIDSGSEKVNLHSFWWLARCREPFGKIKYRLHSTPQMDGWFHDSFAFGINVRVLSSHFLNSLLHETNLPRLVSPPPSVVVVLAFIICWLPYHIGRNLFAQVDDYDTAMLSQNFNMASMVLCYLSASINPVVYNLMSRKYRAAAKRLFLLHQRPRQAHRGQRQLSVIDHISTLNESLTGVWAAFLFDFIATREFSGVFKVQELQLKRELCWRHVEEECSFCLSLRGETRLRPQI